MDPLLAEARRNAPAYLKAAREVLTAERAGGALQPALADPTAALPAGAVVVEAEDYLRGNVLKDRDPTVRKAANQARHERQAMRGGGQVVSASALEGEGLADILARSLSRDPGARYPDAAALAVDLRRHLEHLPLVGVPNRSLAERWHKWWRRHPLIRG